MRLVVDNGPAEDEGPRILAPGAPPSPGPVPIALAKHLEHGEVLVWWGEKTQMQWALVGLTCGAALLALVAATVFAPEFWSQPWRDIAAPVAAILSPTLFVVYREWVARRSILVTDTATVVVDPHDESVRLHHGAIRAISRDWLRGGVRLQGAGVVVFIPTILAEPTRAALASRMRGRLHGATQVDDPLGWLP